MVARLTFASIAGKTLNFNLTTPDDEILGSWFILAEPLYQALPNEFLSSYSKSGSAIRYALQHAPTILLLHGAAGSRAAQWRVATYGAFTSRLACNVLAFDYRGFGDSTGIPTEDGVVKDAYAAWHWLLDNGAKGEDILVVGHSLGTAVTAQFVSRLALDAVIDEKAEKPRGVVLLAPFTSAGSLLETYSILEIPVLQPLQMFPLGISQCRPFHALRLLIYMSTSQNF